MHLHKSLPHHVYGLLNYSLFFFLSYIQKLRGLYNNNNNNNNNNNFIFTKVT